jgi:hypothetical protein
MVGCLIPVHRLWTNLEAGIVARRQARPWMARCSRHVYKHYHFNVMTDVELVRLLRDGARWEDSITSVKTGQRYRVFRIVFREEATGGSGENSSLTRERRTQSRRHEAREQGRQTGKAEKNRSGWRFEESYGEWPPATAACSSSINGTYNVCMFRQAGFFHFVEHHHDPLGALEAEIRATGNVADSLVVLPEAFNLGRPYGSEQEKPCGYERAWLVAKLQELSRDRQITFVVGMLDAIGTGERPRSSAYLINGDDCRIICHKLKSDGTQHYTPAAVDCDIENPMDSVDACVMAIICMDIEENRCYELTLRTEASALPQRFICIPAAMSFSGWLYGSNSGEHINFGPPSKKCNTRIILANSLATGPCSFITDTNWNVVELVPKQRKHHNWVMMSGL